MNPQATPAPLHDIAGPIAFDPFDYTWVIVGGAVLLLALIALVVYLVRKRSRPAKTPYEVANAELAALRSQIGGGDPYAFAVNVSDVLRRYLTHGRGLPASNQTSIEFLETVRRRNVFAEQEREALAAFLEKADLIKFARAHAGSDDCSQLVDSAERLVRSAHSAVEVAG